MLGLWFMNPGDAVAEATSTYFLIRMLCAPFTLGNYVILGWLLGIGRSGLTLAVQLLLNGTNIVFSIVLGLWFGWQIEGVAIATVIGEVLAFGIGCIVCWKLLDHSIRPSKQRVMDWTAWKRLINLNFDIMLRSFALLFAFAYFTAQAAKFGEVTLAANAILMHFFLIAGYLLMDWRLRQSRSSDGRWEQITGLHSGADLNSHYCGMSSWPCSAVWSSG